MRTAIEGVVGSLPVAVYRRVDMEAWWDWHGPGVSLIERRRVVDLQARYARSFRWAGADTELETMARSFEIDENMRTTMDRAFATMWIAVAFYARDDAWCRSKGVRIPRSAWGRPWRRRLRRWMRALPVTALAYAPEVAVLVRLTLPYSAALDAGRLAEAMETVQVSREALETLASVLHIAHVDRVRGGIGWAEPDTEPVEGSREGRRSPRCESRDGRSRRCWHRFRLVRWTRGCPRPRPRKSGRRGSVTAKAAARAGACSCGARGSSWTSTTAGSGSAAWIPADKSSR